MDSPKFKDIIQKLGAIKDYSSLVIPVIITIVAIIPFIPSQIIGSKLKKEIITKSIIEGGDRIKALSERTVASKQWEVERDYQQAYKEDAEQTLNLIIQSNQRPLLSYKIFPEPSGTSTFIFDEFGKQFRDSIEKQLERLKATNCPTEAELENSLPVSSSSSPSSSRSGKKTRSKSDDVESMIKDSLCQKKAESGLVYAKPSDISGYDFWEDYDYPGLKEAVINCWYWQLGYWIIEDVFDTIDSLNWGCSNVYTSPVKRLLGISFSKEEKNSEAAVGEQQIIKVGKPYYVSSDDDGFTSSLTKRFSNAEIDVVHFNVTVLVSTKAVLPFMKELCSAKEHKFRGFTGKDKERIFMHNQITVLQSTTEAIDPEEKSHELYRYGEEDTVVKLDLICEYIFNKSGYDEIKPESIEELAEQ